MQEGFDSIFQLLIEPIDLLDDQAQRERLSRLLRMTRPGVDRALADLLVEVLDEVNQHLDDVRADIAFHGADGGFTVEVKPRQGESARADDEAADAAASGADAEKLTLRLPQGLKERAAAAAAAEGLSLNSWIVRAVSRQLDGRQRERARGGGSTLRGWVGGQAV
jgi:hypothetical protein